jgi:hypothetical protein
VAPAGLEGDERDVEGVLRQIEVRYPSWYPAISDLQETVAEIRALLPGVSSKGRPFVESWPPVVQSLEDLTDLLAVRQPSPRKLFFPLAALKGSMKQAIDAAAGEIPVVPDTSIHVIWAAPPASPEQDLALLKEAFDQWREVAPEGYGVVSEAARILSLGSVQEGAAGSVRGDQDWAFRLEWPHAPEQPNKQYRVDRVMETALQEGAHLVFKKRWGRVKNSEVPTSLRTAFDFFAHLGPSPIAQFRDPHSYFLEIDGHHFQADVLLRWVNRLDDEERKDAILRRVGQSLLGTEVTIRELEAIRGTGKLTGAGEGLVREQREKQEVLWGSFSALTDPDRKQGSGLEELSLDRSSGASAPIVGRDSPFTEGPTAVFEPFSVPESGPVAVKAAAEIPPLILALQKKAGVLELNGYTYEGVGQMDLVPDPFILKGWVHSEEENAEKRVTERLILLGSPLAPSQDAPVLVRGGRWYSQLEMLRRIIPPEVSVQPLPDNPDDPSAKEIIPRIGNQDGIILNADLVLEGDVHRWVLPNVKPLIVRLGLKDTASLSTVGLEQIVREAQRERGGVYSVAVVTYEGYQVAVIARAA